MKKLTMITAPNCAYCKKARTLLQRIYISHPEYASIPVEVLDVREADRRHMVSMNFPCFYIGSDRVFEGYMTIDKLTEIMEAAALDGTLPFAQDVEHHG